MGMLCDRVIQQLKCAIVMTAVEKSHGKDVVVTDIVALESRRFT